jgi:glycosyltransferase involved in cell wall biosynthesis
MKVAMIGQKGVFVTHDGGVEKHVEELSKNLVEMGNEVDVYCRRHFMSENIAEKYEKLKLDQEYLKINGISILFSPSINTKYLDTISHTLTSTIKTFFKKYDVIHYHGIGPSILSFIPRIFSSAKIIVTFHSIDRYHKKWGTFARIMLTFGEWTACNFPNKTIAVSKTIKKYCRDRYKRDAIYIPNGVEVDEAHGSGELEKFGLEPNKYILSVARFVRHKGLHYLIKAFKEIKINGLKLAIVGESPYPNEYADYLKKLAKNEKDIIFTGYQKGEALAQLFDNAYLYCHPSESEGLAITILEAMAYGKCVLISDIEENLEAMSDHGFYFKKGNVKDLSEKLIKLLDDQESVTKMGEKAKEFVLKEHNWKNISRKTLKVYNN